MPPSDRDERVTYTYEPYREDWVEWKRTVPRDIALYQRLDDLRAIDRDFDLRRLVAATHPPPDSIADDRTRLALVRIRQKCMSSLPAAREQGCDTAADELNEIQSICNDLLGF